MKIDKKQTILIEKYHQQHIYVGFSGGADSTLLLLELIKLKDFFSTPLHITAVHFHHGLRDNANKEAKWCQDFCEQHKVSFQLYYLDVPKYLEGKRNIEAVCRELRLKKYQEILADNSGVIALGHHQYDRYENMLMRIFRGGNLSSITSLRSEQWLHGMLFIRPLLDFTRSEIIKKLHNDYNITDYCCDESNNDDRFFRNFLRNKFFKKVFKKFPHTQKGIEHSLRYLEEDALFIETLAQEKLQKILTNNYENKISSDEFATLAKPLRFRVLSSYLQQMTGQHFFCDHNFFEQFNNLLNSNKRHKSNGEAKQLELVKNNYYLQLQNNLFSIEKIVKLSETNELITHEIDISKSLKNYDCGSFGSYKVELFDAKDEGFAEVSHEALNNHNINKIYLDAEKLPQKLLFRYWQHGDYIEPLGQNVSSKLKLKKLFADKKIPKKERYQIPLLITADGGDIIWVVSLRVSKFFAVSNNSQRIIVLSKS